MAADVSRLVRDADRDGDAVSEPIRLVREGARLYRLPPRDLTPAQRRVIELVADGLTNDEIATRLGISRKTVEQHISAAVRALGCASVRHLMYVYAFTLLRDSLANWGVDTEPTKTVESAP